ncbi:MAG: hypothetical protein VYD90_13600 [Pseudomonadota bacterium]|nr:hypothetical protein [Pseudomonadota bacterium]
MRANHFLQIYNQVALAVFLTCGLIFLGAIAVAWWNSTQGELIEEPWDTASARPPAGEEFETSQGTITVYKSRSPDDPEAVRNVRYVAMSSGKIVRITDDTNASVYRERGVGELGRVALVKTGMREDRPVFDIVFIAFPDLDRHVIARSVDALDTVQKLDDSLFSAIIWDSVEDARFVIVDAHTGAIRDTRSLNFPDTRRTSGDS